jgi:dienelactone hydrolase
MNPHAAMSAKPSSRLLPLALVLLALAVPPASAFETITFPSSDGLEITADRYLIDDNSERPCIVLFHQSRWSRGEYRETAPRLNKLGFNCLAIDQRSGNTINGVVNETAQRAADAGLGTEWLDAIPDMKSAIAWARAHHPQAPVIGWGSSYSSSLIIKLAGEQDGLFDGILSFSPGEYFSPSNLIRTAAPGVKVPVFVTSARSEQGRWREIFNAIQSPDKVSFVPGSAGNHGSRSLWSQFADSDSYWTAVEEFLGRWMDNTSSAVIPVEASATRLPSGGIDQFTLEFFAESGTSYRVEASTNLRSWEVLESGINGIGVTIERSFPANGAVWFLRISEE